MIRTVTVVALVSAVLTTGVIVYNTNIAKARKEGYDAGLSFQKAQQAKADKEEGVRRDAEKRRIELDYGVKLATARAALRASDDSVGRLQLELDRIKQFAGNYTGSQPAGTAAFTFVNMLADMLADSNRSYRLAAAEADVYYWAGKACEASYDSLKGIPYAKEPKE